MAWKDTLLDASFKGVAFEVTDEVLQLTKSISSHEYPYVDGADHEDMGLKARHLELNLILWGNDYERRLQELLAVLESMGSGELIHPIYGSIPQAQVFSVRVSHTADTVDACLINVVFEQSTTSAPFFDRELPEALADAIDNLSDIAAWGGFDVLNSVIGFLETNQRRLNGFYMMVMGTVSTLVRQIGTIISLGTSIIDMPRLLIADLENMFDRTRSKVMNASDVFSGYRELSKSHKAIVKAPGKLNQGLKPELGLGTNTDQPGAADTSYLKGVVPPADLLAIENIIHVISVKELAEEVADILAVEIDEPQLTPTEIESITNSVRDEIMILIENTRLQKELFDPPESIDRQYYDDLISTLKNLAFKLQEQASAVINQKPPLVERLVPMDACLKQVAFWWYGDYERAEELYRLNQATLKHPNFIKKGARINAYAR